MESVRHVQYASVHEENCHVIWWETWHGGIHWLTLPIEWYNEGGHPIDAIRQYAPGFEVSAYTHFENMERMYSLPRKGICEGRYEHSSADGTGLLQGQADRVEED